MQKKVITIVACLLLLANTKTFSQIKPSLYTGIGLGTNLGSVVGIGAEIKYDWISFNVAAGPGILAKHSLLYDVGVKLHSKYKFFGGINYGFVRTGGLLLDPDKHDYYGFTFSLGYRFTIYRHFYGMGYLGATSDYLAFMSKEKREHAIIPRIGFIIGYEF